MPYYTHNSTYKESSYNHLYKYPNHLILNTRTENHQESCAKIIGKTAQVKKKL